MKRRTGVYSVSCDKKYETVCGVRMMVLTVSLFDGSKSVRATRCYVPSGFTMSRSLTPAIAQAWGSLSGWDSRMPCTPEKFSWAVRLSYSSGKKVEV